MNEHLIHFRAGGERLAIDLARVAYDPVASELIYKVKDATGVLIGEISVPVDLPIDFHILKDIALSALDDLNYECSP